MKKAKDGAVRRLRIACVVCLFFMIFEFVGESVAFVIFRYCENLILIFLNLSISSDLCQVISESVLIRTVKIKDRGRRQTM